MSKISIYKISVRVLFSSMVPGSRNPMWGEEFNFSVDELPVEVFVSCSNLDCRSPAFYQKS